MIKDLLIWKNANGGDIHTSSDIELGDSLPQLAFLCLFGGNKEASTTSNLIQKDERKDYWANSLFYRDEENKQFNSETERTLSKIALNSNGRIKVLSSVKNDLKKLNNIADISVEVSIKSDYILEINILMTKPNKEERILQIIWDNFKKSYIIEKII